MYINGRPSTTTLLVAGSGTALAAPAFRRISFANGAVGVSLIRMLNGGSLNAYSAIGQAQTGSSCPALLNQITERAVSPGVVPPLAPGALPWTAPLHWWSAAVQPGSWGMADILVDQGGADADAATVRIAGVV